MTVLEKIKRCVSLVWDFQEIYGEEDIEDFCRNELHTYPQYNEILDYFKRIEELNQKGLALQSDMDKTIEQNIALKKELNKANEWHYVKDGKYPTHSNRVLVFTDEGVGFGIYGHDDKKWHTYDTGFDVIAWKEFVLPKESE